MRVDRFNLCLSVFLLTAIMFSPGQSEPRGNGYVPDEATAVRIAEAVFIPIYGEKRLHAEQPFHAVLKGDYWVVSGTLPKPRKPNEVIVGGTMTAEINRLTGCVRGVYHGR